MVEERELTAGARLGGRFVVIDEVARGGMGVVHRAYDERQGDDVALKVLGRTSGTARARFAREAAILARFEHPHVVRYRAHGHDERERPWLAMDWLEGTSLAAALDAGTLAMDDLVELACGLCAGLAAAHREGVVHRDLKPSNVFLVEGRADRAVVLDFGVAHAVEAARVTDTGASVGTPAYMAPEQARGAHEVDHRADLYALGALLFECLTGRPPFVGATPLAVLAKRLLDDAPPVATLVGGVPAPLAEVVDGLLRREVEERPPSAEAVAERLRGTRLAPLALVPRLRGPPVGVGTGERRVASVLLADGGGDETLTACDARVDQDALLRLAQRHGAKLELFAGGSILLRFTGASTAPDNAASAARCALALRAAHRAIAIATGHVILDGDTVGGDAVDRAAALVREGSIGVDETTRDLLGERFLVEGDANREGRWILQGERLAMSPGAVPLVGRRRERKRLLRAYDDVVEDRRPLVVEVTGAAGVGKSRLLAAWLEELRRRPDAPALLVATGRPDHRDLPFGVVTQLVKATSTAAATAYLSIWASPSGPAARDPVLLRQKLAMAFHRWLLELEDEPLVLVVEDLHWADRPSVELLGEALARHEDRALLLATWGRPEVTARFGALWGEHDRIGLRLGALCATAGQELLDTLAVPEAARLEILERAGGHPFQLLEMARAALRGHRTVPGTVLAAAQARLDELSDQARRAARAASVFGRRFDAEGVAAVLGLPAARLRPWLDELVASGLVTDDHAFTHDLLVDATYDTMMPADRAPAHGAAARYLEHRPGMVPETLVRHYGAAGEARRAAHWTMRAAERALELGDLERALELSASSAEGERETRGRLELVAAEIHTWRGRHDEAARHAERALACLRLGAPHAYRAAGLLFQSAGRGSPSTDLVELHEACWGTAPDHAAQAERWLALCHGAQQAIRVGDYARGERGLERLEALPAVEGMVGHLHVLRGMIHQHRGRPADWRRCMEEARQAFADAGDLRMECSLRGEIGFAASEQGDFAHAEAMLAPALEQAQLLGLDHVAAWLLLLRGPVFARVVDLDAGIAVARQAVAAFARLVDPRLEGAAHAYLGALLLEAGALDEAAQEAREARALLQPMPPLLPLALGLAARVEVARGQGEEGLRLAREARACIEAAGGVEEGEAQVDLAEVEALAALGQATASLARAAVDRLDRRAASLPPEARAAFHAIPLHAALRDRLKGDRSASAADRAGSD